MALAGRVLVAGDGGVGWVGGWVWGVGGFEGVVLFMCLVVRTSWWLGIKAMTSILSI